MLYSLPQSHNLNIEIRWKTSDISKFYVLHLFAAFAYFARGSSILEGFSVSFGRYLRVAIEIAQTAKGNWKFNDRFKECGLYWFFIDSLPVVRPVFLRKEGEFFDGPCSNMTKKSTSILLVCDYSIFRAALRLLIESEEWLKVVGEAPISKLTPELVIKSSPDLILCHLSEIDETRFSQLLPPEAANVPILLLTGREEVGFYHQCLKLGIRGLVSKQNGAGVLFKAIEKVSEGEFWYDRSMMGETIRHMLNEKQALLDNPAAQKVNGMTEREKQVVELICKGMKNKGIAEKLFITETTVRHHLTSVFNKLEVENRLELVIYAFKNQLVNVPTNHSGAERNGNGSEHVRFA